MATAGYSGTPLLKKLGLKENWKVWLINPPDNYVDLLDKDISSQICPSKGVPDWVHLFAVSEYVFKREMPRILAAAKKNPQLVIWVSWYKKSSGIVTDVTEDLIRRYALDNGLVDVKVCAVSDQWSGLKLVVPLRRR